MAKIYETEADIKREELREVINGAKSAANNAEQNVLLMSATAIGSHAINKLSDLKVEKFHETPSAFFKGLGKILVGGSIIVGVINAFSYFSWKNKVKKTEAELQQLGPEKIVGPCCAEDYIATKSNHASRIGAEQNTIQIPPRQL